MGFNASPVYGYGFLVEGEDDTDFYMNHLDCMDEGMTIEDIEDAEAYDLAEQFSKNTGLDVEFFGRDSYNGSVDNIFFGSFIVAYDEWGSVVPGPETIDVEKVKRFGEDHGIETNWYIGASVG